jgi:hypothetical protein
MRKYREMTCEEFTARMPQLIASGRDVFAHPHVKKCRTHRALLEELDAIAQVAQQLFPDVDPSDRVWEKIKDEIAPECEVDEHFSDPYPGCHIVVRVKAMHNWNPRDNPKGYDEPMGEGDSPVSGTQIGAGGHKPPPQEDGWR